MVCYRSIAEANYAEYNLTGHILTFLYYIHSSVPYAKVAAALAISRIDI
jgi:hypothetical protein